MSQQTMSDEHHPNLATAPTTQSAFAIQLHPSLLVSLITFMPVMLNSAKNIDIGYSKNELLGQAKSTMTVH